MNDPENPLQTRMDAAELLMRYGRSGGRGKKATLEEAAKAAAKGRFATPPPPTLVVNKDGRLRRLCNRHAGRSQPRRRSAGTGSLPAGQGFAWDFSLSRLRPAPRRVPPCSKLKSSPLQLD
jgi:hypothetical protein